MNIGKNLQRIRERIDLACARSGQNPSEIRLVAVSKGHPPSSLCEAVDEGLTIFGESKVQELKLKVEQCPASIRWEFVGHLQTNKCRDAARLSSMIQSVDTEHLAQSLQQTCEKLSIHLPVLLEVNVSGESSKHGFSKQEILTKLDALNRLDRLEIHGLMTMAPWTKDPEKSRPYFRQLRELRDEAEDHLEAPLPILSMGMSGDFEIAIEEGATCIRLGTALFGMRKHK